MLKDTKIRNAKPKDKSCKLADGHGLYLEIMPTGSKLWRMKFRHAGKENRFSFGAYQKVPLKEAPERCAEARALLRRGVARPPSARPKSAPAWKPLLTASRLSRANGWP
jgi:hypothetical protein